MASEKNLDDLSVAQLRERAARLEIPGRSGMNKSELAAAIAAAGPDPEVEVWQTDSDIPQAAAQSTRGTGLEDPAARLARSEPSQVDAMGQDKRRTVMGQSYGPSLARQAFVYGAFFAVVIALGIGARFAVDELDKPDPSRTNTAPWAAADATNQPPGPIDFPRAITP